MKVDLLSIHFKMFMISSRPSMNLSIHLALTLNYLSEIYQFFLCNESILSSLFKVKPITNIKPEYSEDSFDQTNICQQNCFFIQIQKFIFNLYIGHPSITHSTREV